MLRHREAGRLSARSCAPVCSAEESVNNVMQHKQGGHQQNQCNLLKGPAGNADQTLLLLLLITYGQEINTRIALNCQCISALMKCVDCVKFNQRHFRDEKAVNA